VTWFKKTFFALFGSAPGGRCRCDARLEAAPTGRQDACPTRWWAILLITLALAHMAGAEILPPGNRPVPLGVHALVNGKVVVKPGEVLDSGTILIRDGLIDKVGKDVAVPADARVWDMKGLTIYAGFIAPYLAVGAAPATNAPSGENTWLTAGKFFGVPGGELDPGNAGPGSELSVVTPEFRVAQTYTVDPKFLEKMREIGFTAANFIPEKGVIRGTSALAALSDVEPNRAIIRADVFQHMVFENEGRRTEAFPRSLMGIIAAVRQSFFDAQQYLADHQNYDRFPKGRARPPFNTALNALAPAAGGKMTVVFEPTSALMVDRAARIGRELGLQFYMVSSGQEWRRPDLAKAAAVPFIVPLNFPEISKLPDDDDWNAVDLDQWRAWDWAPENAALLRQQNLEIALTTHGLQDKKNFRKNLRYALDRGLSEDDALAALTLVPARLCAVDSQLGTIEAGKLANLTVVADKGYFDPDARVQSVWIDGRFYRTDTEEPKAERKKEDSTAAEPPKEAAARTPEKAQDHPDGDKAGKEKKTAAARELFKKRVAHSPMEGRGPLTNPPALWFYNAAIWTCGPDGRLQNGAMLIENGRISQVLPALPENHGGTPAIDLGGKNIAPGIIDCHSHSMILGDVNEGTLPSSAMVRIGDVVNSESLNIYYQLAGGVTMAHLLHGSANPIGGQNCLIKLRDGAGPEDLKFQGAPGSIKFALGENVKQSNWGDRQTNRYPQTRMGVQTFIANRFIAGQQYLKQWADYDKAVQSGGTNAALAVPRRDLELEAIGEILQGKRLIHCHSYRQDEILMLLRMMQGFGVQIGTFQHVLEGYKVADELAQGRVGASSFSDWWAYKFEVYDAIPYNGSLMHHRGVVVSFNSDSDDLARRLNLEAAKAVKYGGTSEEEALKFVTLNPAIQLRADTRVGSLQPGKDADFAVWSKSPLDSSSVCLETWIDGKKYFDRSHDAQRTAALEDERKALVEKAKKMLDLGGPSEGGDDAGRASFFQRALEHLHDGEIRHCDDD
jgi:imidazolonepropionase-like amidohydrolase